MGLVQIIKGFSVETSKEQAAAAVKKYVKCRDPKDVLDELPTKYSLSRPAFSRKIRRLGLQYLIFQAATGIEAQEQLAVEGREGAAGYRPLNGLASLLAGRNLDRSEVRDYFKKLGVNHGMPELTREHQAFVDKLSVRYVRRVTRKYLQKMIRLRPGVSLNKKIHCYDPYLAALSKKISKDRELQLDIFKKWTGISDKYEIRVFSKNGVPGYSSLLALAKLLSGEVKGRTEAGNYFRSLFEKNK